MTIQCTYFPLCVQTERTTLRLCQQKFPIILLFSFFTNIRTSTRYLNIIWYSYIYFLDAAASNLLDQFKLSVWASVRFKQHLIFGIEISTRLLFVFMCVKCGCKWLGYYDGLKRHEKYRGKYCYPCIYVIYNILLCVLHKYVILVCHAWELKWQTNKD